MSVDATAARAELAEHGAVAIPGLLDATWCDRLHRAIERCRLVPSIHHGVLSPAGAPRVDSDLFRWTDDPDLHELTHRSPLVGWACALLDEDHVVLVEDQWFSSEPGATTPSPWHQDQPYYRVDRPFLTLWVTLDDISATASLRVVPGSHRGPTFAPVEFAASAAGTPGTAPLPPPPDVDERIPGAVRTWSLNAGDAIALDSRTLHATGRTALDGPFRRISTRWASPSTRYVDRLDGSAAFWDLIQHGRGDGDLLACAAFPLVERPVGR